MHENLNIALDLDQLLRMLRRKDIVPQEWVDKRGCRHRVVVLFAKQCETPTETKTHNITAKSPDNWSDLRNNEGVTVYFGTARPSRFQPRKPADEFDV